MIRTVAIPVVALMAAATPAPSQTWRTLDAAGTTTDTGPVSVRIEYTRGELQARPIERGGLLYDLHLRYDAARARPLLTFDTIGRSLAIGAQARPDTRARTEGRGSGDAVLQLGRGAPLNVAVRLDVATANLDLGGLSLRSLAVHASASEARVRFDTANGARMETLDLDISAATLTASGLANARAARVRVAARAGNAELDLGGQWERDMELEIDITLATVTVYVPADVGIELETTRRMLATVNAGGLRRSGDMYVSANSTTAPRKLRVRAGATLGKLTVIHGSR